MMTARPEAGATWLLRGGRAFVPAPFGVMGIVNVTPDSFYDGGSHNLPQAALDHARRLWGEGAHILDLGAESSRPGSAPLAAEEELARLLPVLDPLLQEVRNAPEDMPPPPLLSVDTYHADTARAVLERDGVDILNDISACRFDPRLLEVVASFKPGYVLMHAQGLPQSMQQAPRYSHVLDEVLAFFEEHMTRLIKAGLPEGHIALDPGIGFGKNVEHNLELLRGIRRILDLGRPVLMALSMKSLFAHLLPLPDVTSHRQDHMHCRATATQAATALLAARGVRLHRVHHVAETLHTLTLTQAFSV